MTKQKDVHESVLIGYFCQACGWIQRDIQARRPEKAGEPADRLLRAVNLSHNPLDPAVGDLILQLDESDALPEKFFIFELKVDWADHVKEREKLLSNKFDDDLEKAKRHVEQLLTKFPSAQDSHLFGGLSLPPEPKVLHVGPYWDAIFSSGDVPWKKSALWKKSAFHWLNAIVEPTAKGGLTFDDLAAYIQELNSLAPDGSAAQAGADRFITAYRDYQLYLFQEDAVERVVLQRKDRLLEQQRSRQRA